MGPTLLDIKDDMLYAKITRIDALKVGISLIRLLEKVHGKGIVHGDIKIDNIVIDRQEMNSWVVPVTQLYSNVKNQLYLIDYGMSQKY